MLTDMTSQLENSTITINLTTFDFYRSQMNNMTVLRVSPAITNNGL